MAWKTEGKDIVLYGTEDGIADSPEKGIADMRNVNIVSIPGEAMVGFATTADVVPPTYTTVATVFSSAADTVTYTSTAVPLYDGCPVTFDATTGGVTSGAQYWAGNTSGGALASCTFKVYTNIARTILVDLSANSTPNFSTVTMGATVNYNVDYLNKYVFVIDTNGRAWWRMSSVNTWTFVGNTTLANAHGNGIVTQNGTWLLVFRDSIIDYFAITDLTSNSASVGQWTFSWKTGLNSVVTAPSHQPLVAVDNNIYFPNGYNVGAIRTVAGQSFDPSNTATFTFANNAITGGLPQTDPSTCLAELGGNLLIGGTINRVYQWDKVSTNTSYPIYLPENNTTRIVTTNSIAYIFAGNRGRIYECNGSSVDLYKKIPDQLAGVPDPYYAWGAAIYLRGQLYFGITATTNAGGALTTHGGIWAIDLATKALRGTHSLSYSGFGGSTQAIIPIVSTASPAGTGFFIAWTNGSTFGIDTTSSSPYSGSEPKIDYDIVPVGKFLEPKTIENVEFKLAAPLVSGESVTIYARSDISASYTQVGTTTTVGAKSDVYNANFGPVEWIQLRVVPNSTASSPSYVRLTEVRIR